MKDCLLNCLGLSQMLLDAAESGKWARMQALQAAWEREVAACVPALMEIEDRAEAAAQLSRLLADVEEKSRQLEQIIQRLQAQQQKELQQLRQAEAYLISP